MPSDSSATSAASESPPKEKGWRQPNLTPSLQEVHGSVPIRQGLGFWGKLLAFSGPGYLVAVGYMDPGNWATDIAGGSAYGYKLQHRPPLQHHGDYSPIALCKARHRHGS